MMTKWTLIYLHIVAMATLFGYSKSQRCGELKLYTTQKMAKMTFTPKSNVLPYHYRERIWQKQTGGRSYTVYNSSVGSTGRVTETKYSQRSYVLKIERLTPEDAGQYKMTCKQSSGSSPLYWTFTTTVDLHVETTTLSSSVTPPTSPTDDEQVGKTDQSQDGDSSRKTDQSQDGDSSAFTVIIVAAVGAVVVLVVIVTVAILVLRRKRTQAVVKTKRSTAVNHGSPGDGRPLHSPPNTGEATYDDLEDMQYCTVPSQSPKSPRSLEKETHQHGACAEETQEAVEYAVAVPKSQRNVATDAEYSTVMPRAQRQQTSPPVTPGSTHELQDGEQNGSSAAEAEYAIAIPKSQRPAVHVQEVAATPGTHCADSSGGDGRGRSDKPFVIEPSIHQTPVKSKCSEM